MDGAKGTRGREMVVVVLLPRQGQREHHISSVRSESRSGGSGKW